MTMRYAVVGAGLAGLTAAYELKKNHPDAAVQVFEATDRIGGKLLTIDAEHGPTDMGAEAFINFRRDAHAFFDELGIKDRLVYPAGRHSRVYSGGTLQELPRGGVMGIPASSAGLEKIISAESCARIDAEAQGEGIDWTVGEDRSLGKLVRERYGDDVVEHLVDSMLGGVYSCNADELGVRATVPQL
ncbi:MAG: FAD-dependent oxidoreductase, partial [Mixta calida]|nr:FAD-dependent oxidoreductase [Mixta calida]